jgi:hypothetical protein
MKTVACIILIVLVCLARAFADCTPQYTSTESDIGCGGDSLVPDSLTKDVSYTLQWPDGFTETIAAIGYGKCNYTNVCCSPN